MMPLPDVAMTFFYGHLFAAAPEVRAMFPAAMGEQQHRFYRALTLSARPDTTSNQRDAYLAALGRAHRKYGVRPEHYAQFRAALAAACREFSLGPQEEAQTLAAFDHAAAIMAAAAEAEEGSSPAWWTAEVIRHDEVAPDVAVLALRADQPLPYQAGQHIWVQSPRWPRLWRPYSVACAPRPDATLALHVRAVPGGLVSTALVHHARAGDTLLLGAAEGTMTPPPGSQRGALCLAGGTGLAPLLAITEALLSADPARDVVIYHGARTADGLYGLGPLRALARRHPSLTVIPATSLEQVPQAAHGTIAALAAQAPWQDRDIFIAGPQEMITAASHALQQAGAPPELIRYDLPAIPLDLPPPRDPGTVAGDLVVTEQGGGFAAHEGADLAEHQADLLFGSRVGAHLDGVPQRADVRGPRQAGGDPVGSEAAHE